MASLTETLSSVAEDLFALTDAARTTLNYPLDQIRRLAELARFGREEAIGDDPIGIAGFRNAGASNVYANTQRASAGTYIDAGGNVVNAAPKTVRPVFTNGVVTGYLDEPQRTNLQVSSGFMRIGTSFYAIGANTNDGGLVSAPDGTLSARKVISNSATGANVYFSRNSALAVSPSTAYTIGASYRLDAGAPASGRVLTVDLFNGTTSTRVQGTSIGALGLQQGVYARASKTITTLADTVSMMVYYLDGPVTGQDYAVWGCQIEQASNATSFIYTPSGAGATRNADAITLGKPPVLSAKARAERDLSSASAAQTRRAALCSIARAIISYEPASADEAQGVLKLVVPLFDEEILDAADAGHDATYTQLRKLRAAIVQDLTERSIDLPSLVDVISEEQLPALVHAQELYGDGRRADELAAGEDVIHPLFLPRRFRALNE